MRFTLALLPFVGFAALAAIFYTRVGAGDPSTLPSALIGKNAPVFNLAAIPGSNVPGFSDADLKKGRMTFVNVWASWCLPCRDEHPLLLELAETARRNGGFDVVGINYKDQPANALKFLEEGGNPFKHLGADTTGRVGIDWGVYGVPESYIVDGAGKIVFKHVGPLTRDTLLRSVLPLLENKKS